MVRPLVLVSLIATVCALDLAPLQKLHRRQAIPTQCASQCQQFENDVEPCVQKASTNATAALGCLCAGSGRAELIRCVGRCCGVSSHPIPQLYPVR